MPKKARPERHTQNRVVALFTRPKTDGALGYRYLGDWQRPENESSVNWIASNSHRRLGENA